MNKEKKGLWLSLSLFNLCIVAFLGFALRSKILFPLHFLDYSGLLSAHSHFAFAGWAGLSFVTLFIYDLLPQEQQQRKIYQWILTAIEISALGMALLFPFIGYNFITITFSTLYVIAIFLFVPIFIKDILRARLNKITQLLSISALVSLLFSFLGTVGLMYIIASKSGGSLLYRDSIYTFLHFQYNGFFTLSVFALFMNSLLKKGFILNRAANLFSTFLCISIIPALFLSLLWHNKSLFYLLASVGCFFILMALYYLFLFLKSIRASQIFSSGIAKTFWKFSVISFVLKMILQVGTIFPQVGDAVYGDRPVIIGFLHLVFLGFITFFILAILVECGYFTSNKKILPFPFVVFSTGILANEFVLMVQGLGILFKTNNDLYKWLLWVIAIILFFGAVLLALSRLRIIRIKKAILTDGSK